MLLHSWMAALTCNCPRLWEKKKIRLFIYLRNKINKPRTCKRFPLPSQGRKMAGCLFCKTHLYVRINFLNPTPTTESLKKTAEGKVAKAHFSDNKTKNPITSASSWHSFLTLPNQVTQKTWGMSGPTHTSLVHQWAPRIQCGSAQRHSAPVAGSACNTRGQKSEWHLALSLSTNNRKVRSKPRPSPFWRLGSWSLPGVRGEKEISPSSQSSSPKVTLQTRGHQRRQDFCRPRAVNTKCGHNPWWDQGELENWHFPS